MVINYDEAHEPGTHWVAVYATDPNHVYYLDSLGGVGVPNICDYLQRHFKTVTMMQKPLQAPGTRVCGQYAIVFIYLAATNFPIKNIPPYLVKTGNPDKFVAEFVRRLVAKHRLSRVL